MKKFNLKISIWAFLLVFSAQLILPIVLSPNKVHAEESVASLKSKVKEIQKLRGLRDCVDRFLATDGIGKSSGPWNIYFNPTNKTVNTPDTVVGHGLETGDGKWDCGSPSGDREDRWFKSILKNGSDSDYYGGWNSGEDNSYKSEASKNLRSVKKRRLGVFENEYLVFINRDNLANHSGGGELTNGQAKAKVRDQIGRTIAVIERGLTQPEKDTMAYFNLSWTFADSHACKAQTADNNSGGKKVKIGNKLFTVGNPGGKNAVGFGFYGDNGQGKDGGDGNLTCEQIADRMAELASSYEKVTGDTGTIPEGSNRAEEGDDDTPGDAQAQCQITPNPITWIMCALITGFTEAIQALDSEVTNLLDIKAVEFFGEGAEGDNFNDIWKGTRTIALGFLIIVALVMIISTAIGVGPFDAYTVKKVMPRLVVVIILIPLSWAIVYFMIEMTSVIGYGVRNLIQAPFVDTYPDVRFTSSVSTTAAAGLLGAGLAIGLPGLLSFLVGGFLAVFIAYVTLVLRQIFIILLAVIAPLALVAAILPNTQKAWKFWWESFWKALLVFPIIMAFIAVGRVFALVAQASQGTAGDYIAFIAYFAPYFLIPTAFKMAGGLLGNITGAVNDRGRGAFDRLKKFRQGQLQKNTSKIQDGTRFNPNKAMGRALNNPLRQASQLNKAGLNPLRMRANLNSATANQDAILAQEKAEKDPDIAAIKNDDDLLRSFRDDTSREAMERRLTAPGMNGRFGQQGSRQLANTVAAIERAQKVANPQARQLIASEALAATGTGYETHSDMYQAAIDASNGNASVRNSMFAKMKAASERAGRFDLSSPGHVESMEALDDLERGADPEEINQRMRAHAFRSVGAHKLVQGKPGAVADLATQLGEDYVAARDIGDVDTATDLAGQITALRSASGSATPEGREAINAMLHNVGIDEGRVNPTTGAAVSVDEQLGETLGNMNLRDPGFQTNLQANYAGEIEQRYQQRAREMQAQVGVGPLRPQDLAAAHAEVVRSVAQQVSGQQVRTRAGSYDAGGGTRMPEQLRGQQRNPDEI